MLPLGFFFASLEKYFNMASAVVDPVGVDLFDAGFARCSWPFWDTDDFTLCFQLEYATTLF